jgi:predicted metal-dependent phosphoesterase TrpH
VHSACSALTPEALVRAAKARGLDGVCITEHDALWPIEDITRLSEEMDFLVLRGIEVTTEVGHVLCFGLDEHQADMATLDRLRAHVEHAGALMYLAHPSRRYGTLPPADLSAYFDGVEAQNGTEGALQNGDAARLGERLRLPGIGGSDAHSAREIGHSATLFDSVIRDEPSFLAALRSGAYRAKRT